MGIIKNYKFIKKKQKQRPLSYLTFTEKLKQLKLKVFKYVCVKY